jgi:hypothetical protein
MRRHPIHTGNGLPQGDGSFKRADLSVDHRFHPPNALAESFPFVQVFG